jgi:hypothetical protein
MHKDNKMISEVFNTILLTYLVTEYLAATNTDERRYDSNWQLRLVQPRTILAAVVVVFLNIFDRVSGFALFINDTVTGFFHMPKVLFVAWAYVLVLYVDCRRISPELDFTREFMPKVGRAFLYVLPVYPISAVLISFGFFIVITICDALHLPEDWLQWPIYYGTLYGPFSLVYWKVKKTVTEDRATLPSLAGHGRSLGD